MRFCCDDFFIAFGSIPQPFFRPVSNIYCSTTLAVKIFFKNHLTNLCRYDIIYKSIKDYSNIEMWLSLVERCVRDAEVAGSNPVISTSETYDRGK